MTGLDARGGGNEEKNRWDHIRQTRTVQALVKPSVRTFFVSRPVSQSLTHAHSFLFPFLSPSLLLCTLRYYYYYHYHYYYYHYYYFTFTSLICLCTRHSRVSIQYTVYSIHSTMHIQHPTSNIQHATCSIQEWTVSESVHSGTFTFSHSLHYLTSLLQ